jgi:pre-mRNA-splicing helicase BRR2
LKEEEDGMMIDEGTVPVSQIDAYWMQRQVSVFCGDANKAQALAERLLVILQEQQDDATVCENKLVELLEYEQFDFVRLLMHNRFAIVWTTLYRRAKDDKERHDIESAMEGKEHLVPVLDQLRGKQQKKKKTAASSALSAAAVASAVDEGGVMPMEQEEDENVPAHWKIARKVLDLDQLAFYEGGRFMANKTVVLPPGFLRRNKKKKCCF